MASFQHKPDEHTTEHYHINLWPQGVASDCGCFAMIAVIAVCVAAVKIVPYLTCAGH
jgi:hypothetical protein